MPDATWPTLVDAAPIDAVDDGNACCQRDQSTLDQLVTDLNEFRRLHVTVPITGWANTTRRSNPGSVGRKPLRSGHSSCTTSNGAPRYHA